MKRILAGIGWFFGLYFGIIMSVATVLGVIYQAKTGDVSYEGNYAVGNEFGQRFGGLVFLFSLLVSIAGTWGGVLPGTKKAVTEKKDEPEDSRDLDKAA